MRPAVLRPVIENSTRTERVPAGQSPRRNARVVPCVGPVIRPTSRQDAPPSQVARTLMISLASRARAWAESRNVTRSPGTSTGRVIVPTPPFHQHEPSRTSRLSNLTPIVWDVSFRENSSSGVIRKATDRVAIVGSSPSAETVIVFVPSRQQRERARGVLDVVLHLELVEPRAAGRRADLDAEHEVVAAEDLVAKVDRRRFRPDLCGLPDRGEGPAVIGRERDRHAVGLGLPNRLELDPAAEVDVRAS